MSVEEIVLEIDALPPEDQQLIMRHLRTKWSREAELYALVPNGVEVPYWTPHDDTETAAKMMEYLETERAKR